MPEINWELIKFKYEVLEISLDRLAEEHGISPSALQYAAKNWEQVPLVERGEDFDAVEGVQSGLVEQSKIFSMLKEKFLGPKYIELETTLLHKAIEIANSIPAEGIGAAKIVKDLAEIYKNLTVEKNKDIDNHLIDTPTKWEVVVVDPEVKKEDESEIKTSDTTKVSPIRYKKEAI